MEKEEFESSSTCLNGTIFYVKDVVKFVYKGDIHTGKLNKFYTKVHMISK